MRQLTQKLMMDACQLCCWVFIITPSQVGEIIQDFPYHWGNRGKQPKICSFLPPGKKIPLPTWKNPRKIHFSIFTMQIFPTQSKTSRYQSIMQFLNPKQRKFFSVDVKNNFNMSCVDKSQTCVCHILEMVNFTDCRT